MFVELLTWNGSVIGDLNGLTNSVMTVLSHDFKSLKVLVCVTMTFGLACVIFVVVSLIFSRNSWRQMEHNQEEPQHQCSESNSLTTNYESLDLTPYVADRKDEEQVQRIVLNFLPDESEIIAVDDDSSQISTLRDINWRKQAEIEQSNEPESLVAMNLALKMKQQKKFEKAQKLFQHAMALHASHPDVLNSYGEFLEEEKKDIIKADHLYTKALMVCPKHSRALVNQQRTLPVVHELDEKQLSRIDKKRDRLIKIPHNDPSLKRMKKEAYFQHIHHTVAIEGNTMTLAETRQIVETRMAVPGKSIVEHNEIIGLESALRYLNTSLVNKEGFITVEDILQIHKRVMGNVDPIEAGCLRQTQVFVGEHTPPAARYLPDLMEDFVEWLRSESVLKLHPVKQAALAHYKLVYIHPFLDGNGRTARLLMNLILMRAGYPPVIVRKQDRALYYEYLQIANEGDVRPFIRFIAQSTEGTLDVYLYATEYGMAGVKGLGSNSQDQGNVIKV